MKSKTRKFSGKAYRLAQTGGSKGSANHLAMRLRQKGCAVRVTFDHAAGGINKVFRVWSRAVC